MNLIGTYLVNRVHLMRSTMTRVKQPRLSSCHQCKHFREMRKERGLCMFFSKVVNPVEDRCQTAFEPKNEEAIPFQQPA